MQDTRYLFKPRQREVSRLAQVLFRELLPGSQVGIPVAITPLRRFLACSVGTCLTSKSERGDLNQPGEPGGATRHDIERHVALTFKEPVGVVRGRPGERIDCDLWHEMALVR